MNALMLLGTASGVGKSLLTAGLCRILARSGVDVAPFKPQNMSNNAAACADGGEIGRAQAFQAFAAGVEPDVDMNPVLLKPEGDRRAQIIVLGKPAGVLHASRFREDREPLLPTVLAAFERLRRAHEFVLVEGAGSPAEPNLRIGDIANMGFAEAADVPAWLIGDIDRGGVFASILGTFEALDAADRARIEAVLINRFRGDPALLADALPWLEARVQRPLLGVVPHVPDLVVPEEDAPYRWRDTQKTTSTLRIVCPVPPAASNLTDLDALALDSGTEVVLTEDPDAVAGADLVILPGSKAVARDLAWLHERGFVRRIEQHLRYGGRVLGICGGLQMLGRKIHDPAGVEAGRSVEGLGWLPIETTLRAEKRVTLVEGTAPLEGGVFYRGYEIHHGDTPAFHPEGPFCARSEDGQIHGTYLHGLFDAASFRGAWLRAWFDPQFGDGPDIEERWRTDLDRLADHLCAHLDLTSLGRSVGKRLA